MHFRQLVRHSQEAHTGGLAARGIALARSLVGLGYARLGHCGFLARGGPGWRLVARFRGGLGRGWCRHFGRRRHRGWRLHGHCGRRRRQLDVLQNQGGTRRRQFLRFGTLGLNDRQQQREQAHRRAQQQHGVAHARKAHIVFGRAGPGQHRLAKGNTQAHHGAHDSSLWRTAKDTSLKLARALVAMMRRSSR